METAKELRSEDNSALCQMLVVWMSSSGRLIRKGMNRNQVKNKNKKQQKIHNLLNIQQLGADTQNEENRQPTVSVG